MANLKLNRQGSYESALKLLDSFGLYSMKFGLVRIRGALKELGNPERRFKAIHIAGSNGKGSVCAYVSNVLFHSGFNVGLYTSPHILDVRERVAYNNCVITKNEFAALVFKYYRHAKKWYLTYFEFLTLLAFVYYAEKQADFVVLETGLGGRLDATNVITPPLVAVITSISYEHTYLLGNTLSAIAKEKAGIIKRGGITVTGALPSDAAKVIKRIAKKLGNDLYIFDKDFGVVHGVVPGIKGDVQKINAAVAVKTINALEKYNIIIPQNIIKHGIESASIPGRFEEKVVGYRHKKIRFVFDISHNSDALGMLMQALEKFYKNKKKVIIFGVLKDKDIERIGDVLLKNNGVKYILCNLKTPRSADVNEVAKVLYRKGIRDIVISDNIEDAVYAAAGKCYVKNAVVVVTGSFYTVAEVKELVGI
ncbi:MAG: folylpolyglutamate synthase/dihydrofolate synthase family protein [Elusimicrobiota bacterium]